MEDIDTLYKISEVARLIKASRATVYRLFESGALDSVKSRGTRYVTHSQLLTFVERLKATQL
jgi:excisionase family DNA binding protein